MVLRSMVLVLRICKFSNVAIPEPDKTKRTKAKISGVHRGFHRSME
jgi:hypothetical protein